MKHNLGICYSPIQAFSLMSISETYNIKNMIVIYITYNDTEQDHYYFDRLKKYYTEAYYLILKNKNKFSLESEEKSRINARRSIIVNNNLEKNSIIKESDLITKRPGTGIEPTNWNNIIGKKINKNIKKDSILHWYDIIDS